MNFNIWTFLFEVVNFLVLVYVLRRLLYKPLHAAIEERQQANAQARADAEQAQHDATALQQQLSAQRAALEQERQDLIQNARQQAEAERKATAAETEHALQKRRDEVAQQIEHERAEALQSLRAELLRSSVALAERFLQEAADSTLRQQLAGRLIESLQNVPEDERLRLREGLGAEESAVVETASDLNGELVQRLDDAVKTLAGRAVNLSVQTRPELIGGLRLRLGGHVWDAALAGCLSDGVPSVPVRSPL